MAATIRAVLEGIEARLQTIEGLRVTAHVPDKVNIPAAFVGVPPIPQYHGTFRMGRFMIEPTVTVLTSAAYARTGQLALADYADPAGPLSIRAAIEADKTLGGAVDDCIVASFEPLGVVRVGDIDYTAGQFTLRAIATGN